MQAAAVSVEKHLFQTSRMKLHSDLSNPTQHCWLKSATYRTPPATLCTRNLSQHKHPDCPVPTLIFLTADWTSVSWTVASKKRKKQSPNVEQGARQKKVLSVQTPAPKDASGLASRAEAASTSVSLPRRGGKGPSGKRQGKETTKSKEERTVDTVAKKAIH